LGLGNATFHYSSIDREEGIIKIHLNKENSGKSIEKKRNPFKLLSDLKSQDLSLHI
jgi:hypothetical protein